MKSLLFTILVATSATAHAFGEANYKVQYIMNYVSSLIYENMAVEPAWSSNVSTIKKMDGVVCSKTKSSDPGHDVLANDYVCDLGNSKLSFGRVVFTGKVAELAYEGLVKAYRAGQPEVYLDAKIDVPGLGPATLESRLFGINDDPEVVTVRTDTFAFERPLECMNPARSSSTAGFGSSDFSDAAKAGILPPKTYTCILDLR
jgi:hypothetical protein